VSPLDVASSALTISCLASRGSYYCHSHTTSLFPDFSIQRVPAVPRIRRLRARRSRDARSSSIHMPPPRRTTLSLARSARAFRISNGADVGRGPDVFGRDVRRISISDLPGSLRCLQNGHHQMPYIRDHISQQTCDTLFSFQVLSIII
jgi:hypothetical protein